MEYLRKTRWHYWLQLYLHTTRTFTQLIHLFKKSVCVSFSLRTQAEMGHTCRGTINLATANIAVEDSCNFVISNGGAQTYHLKASSEVERQRWITALELAKAKAVHMHAESGKTRPVRSVTLRLVSHSQSLLQPSQSICAHTGTHGHTRRHRTRKKLFFRYGELNVMKWKVLGNRWNEQTSSSLSLLRWFWGRVYLLSTDGSSGCRDS